MRKRNGSILIVCLLVTILILVISYSDQVMESVSFSISIWIDNLFPSLFPFFILSNCLLQYGFVDLLSNIFKRWMPAIFHLPGAASFVLIISLISGFPSGAKYTTELVKNKILSQIQGEHLLTFTHYSNPLFVLGMIGGILLGNKQIAFLILGCHIVSNIIIGLLFRPKEKIAITSTNKSITTKESVSLGNVLRKSIFDAIQTMVLLLGIVTIFLIITTILEQLFHFSPLIKTFIAGILEMTQGVKLASSLPISLLAKAMLMTFFISFGGLSVHVQVLSIISEAKIKYKYFFLARLLHGIFASTLVFLFYYLFF